MRINNKYGRIMKTEKRKKKYESNWKGKKELFFYFKSTELLIIIKN